MKKYRLFQKLLVLIFFIFLGILVFAVIYAHTRKSGATGLSMSHIQEIRIKEKTKNL